MSKEKFSEILNQPEPTGPVEAFLSQLKEMGGEVWDAAKPSFDHGRAELAAVLYNGSAHVMYGHTQNEVDQPAPDHGLSNEAVKQQEQDQGMEM